MLLLPSPCFAACNVEDGSEYDIYIDTMTESQTVCIGTEITFSGTYQDDKGFGISGTVDEWEKDGSTMDNPYTFDEAGTFTITGIATDYGYFNTSCTASKDITITVIGVKSLTVPETVCIGADATFEATPDPDTESFPSGSPEWEYKKTGTGGAWTSAGSGSSVTLSFTETGKYQIKAACKDSEQKEDFHVVAVERVDVDKTAVCVESDVTITAKSDPNNKDMDCIEWQKRHKAKSGDSWGAWEDADSTQDDPAKVILNTEDSGLYQYQARDGSGDTWKQSSEIEIHKTEFAEDEIDVCWSAGGTYTAKDNLTDDSFDRDDKKWSIKTLDGKKYKDFDTTDGKVTFSDDGAGKYEITAKSDGVKDCEATMTLAVVTVDLKSIGFTSDHNLLKKNPTSGSVWGDSTTDYESPEWFAGSRNNPISHTKNTKISTTVKVKVEPSDINFDLIGDGPDGYVDFETTGQTSTGADQDIPVTANANLPDQVSTLTKSIDWKIKVGTTECSAGSSGAHKIYVTYGTPSGSVVTEKRISWACTKADGSATEKDCADHIHDALGNVDPPHEPDEKPNLGTGWELLGTNTYGECHQQADLMKLALEMLGVPATSYLTYASKSTDTNVMSPDSKIQDGKLWWLVFDFDGNGVADNRFEGSVEVASHNYAVWPKLDANSKCELLRQVGPDNYGAKQVWVRMDDDTIDGNVVETLPGFEGYPTCP